MSRPIAHANKRAAAAVEIFTFRIQLPHLHGLWYVSIRDDEVERMRKMSSSKHPHFSSGGKTFEL